MFLRSYHRQIFAKILSIIFLMTVLDGGVFAASKATKLKHLIHKIDTLQTNLKQAKKQQNVIETQLKHAEVAIGNYSMAIKNTGKKLDKEKKILNDLKIKQGYNRGKLSEEKNRLSQEIRDAYLLSRVNYIKVLLNQEEPAQVNRMYVYYQYLLQDRAKNIAAISTTLKKLRQNDLEIKKQSQILQKLYAHQKSEKGMMEKEQKKRNAALKSINGKLVTQKTRLQRLLADKLALERLIAKINARSRKVHPVTITGSLSMLRGKLLSPTSGRITNAFGKGETQLNGVIISAAEDQEVHAIAKGQVVFADWLPGYGLMIIIDHGHGYMSLYGRNHNLYKKTGDEVEVGDLIAAVGNSGGYEKTGLYFAMRYNGKPIDPTVWCKI